MMNIYIEVGNDPYVKVFRDHMNILNYRSLIYEEFYQQQKKR